MFSATGVRNTCSSTSKQLVSTSTAEFSATERFNITGVFFSVRYNSHPCPFAKRTGRFLRCIPRSLPPTKTFSSLSLQQIRVACRLDYSGNEEQPQHTGRGPNMQTVLSRKKPRVRTRQRGDDKSIGAYLWCWEAHADGAAADKPRHVISKERLRTATQKMRSYWTKRPPFKRSR